MTAPAAPAALGPADVLARAWALHPSVAVRPEPFGALLYHFGTRRLSFLKDRVLLDAVQRLATSPDAASACRGASAAAGLGEGAVPRYARALATLAATGMLEERR